MSATKKIIDVLAAISAGAWKGVLLSQDEGSGTHRKIADKGDENTYALKEKLPHSVT